MNMFNDVFIENQIIQNCLKNYNINLDLELEYYPPDVRSILKYMHNHLFENTLTIKEEKLACRIRNNNISTKFRLLIGMGIKEYVMNQRLKAAETVLKETEVSIYLLANAIGYT